MTSLSRVRRVLRLLAVVGVMTLLVASCGDDKTTSSTTTSPVGTTPDDVASAEVSAYFMREEKVGPVARTSEAGSAATDAVEGLLSGPDADETEIGLSTAIPDGTTLLSLDIEDGVATVDLSSEFGSGGGSLSMMSRVAQVVFTLTQFPNVESVLFMMDGEPVEALGGEGLVLDEPQTRADWEEMAPAILVESPLPFAEVDSPLAVTGTANTFEATFQLNITDGEGEIVYDEPVTATSGTGTRGDFEVTAEFEVPRAGVGALIVFEISADDGSQTNLVEIPLTIS